MRMAGRVSGCAEESEMMTESATVRRINAQCQERWLHVPTNHEYRLIMEIAGACELEGIDRRTTYRSREVLEGSDEWRRVP